MLDVAYVCGVGGGGGELSGRAVYGVGAATP